MGKIQVRSFGLWREETACVFGRAHGTSDVKNPPVGGEKYREKEQLFGINPSLSEDFLRNLPPRKASFRRAHRVQVGTSLCGLMFCHCESLFLLSHVLGPSPP